MSEGQKKITRWLLWGGYAIFLGVSIPHIAWVFRQYTPTNTGLLENVLYWLLATGYAIAIDGVMAWLSHTQSQRKHAWTPDYFITWGFIIALVGMSWYLNWVYDLAHDPSQTLNSDGINMGVWNHLLIWGHLDGFTVGAFTPTLLGALPVFTIAYVSVLNKVHAMEEQDAKSADEIERDADDTERREAAMDRIKKAKKKYANEEEVTGFERFTKRAIRAGKTVAKELANGEEKRDPRLQKLVTFFADTPELLNDKNKTTALAIVKKELKLKDRNLVEAWYLKVQKIVLVPEGSSVTEDAANGALTGNANSPSNDSLNPQDFGTISAQNEPLTDSLNESQEGTLEGEKTGEETELFLKEEDRITGTLEGQSDEDSLEEEELHDGEEEGKTTDPQIEATNILQFPPDGKTSESGVPTLDITGRRKPLTLSEAMEALGVSEKTVRNWKKSGQLESPNGEERLITVASVKRMLEARLQRKVAAK